MSLSPPPLPRLDCLAADERDIDGTIWRRVDNGHRARGKVLSPVWVHGALYCKLLDPTEIRWICHYCPFQAIPQGGGNTGNYLRHVRDHGLLSSKKDGAGKVVKEKVSKGVNALVTRVEKERFRMLLLRFIIECTQPYSIVEKQQFRDLLLYSQPSLNKLLVKSANTIKKWATGEFNLGREAVKQSIKRAKSQTHISFDIWTSPARTPILGICGHYLDQDMEMKHPLLALRHLPERHTGPLMAEVILKVLKEYEIVVGRVSIEKEVSTIKYDSKLGAFVADNADNNNTCVRALNQELHPDEDENGRRGRCFGHMVNIAAKAFIYGKKHEAFIKEAD